MEAVARRVIMRIVNADERRMRSRDQPWPYGLVHICFIHGFAVDLRPRPQCVPGGRSEPQISVSILI